ncbi:MAG TPA: cbb3-type cytochrome c oxidase N-terminal domain-containing protein [Polyangiaceae bacterium]
MTLESVHPSAPLAADVVRDEPVAHNEGAILEHEYDGIREYDNPLPGWWTALFWGSIAFSIGYCVYYYLSPHGVGVLEAYEEDMRVAREERAKQSLAEAPSEAVLGKLMADRELMQDAKVTFGLRCSPCHGPQGQGLIGPNLTDEYVIHGEHGLMDIYTVISRGVPSKGMPAWELQLKPIEVRKLAAYIGTLRGTHVAGKAPEGRLVGKR